jgi:biopolymer transport protein ExbB/biopolymer transport protein TolQ
VLIQNLEKIALLGSGWVLYLLMMLSVASIGVMLDRWIFFRKHRGDADQLGDTVVERLQHGDRRGAREVLKHSATVESDVVLPALEWMDGGPDAVSEALAAQMQRKQKELNRGMTFLGTLGNNAPFVGLLGTVIGVIQAFHQLGQGHSEAAMGSVMVGISEALIATGVGLFVALPAVVGFNLAQKRIGDIENNVEMIGKQLLAFLKSEDKVVREFHMLDELPPRRGATSSPRQEEETPTDAIEAAPNGRALVS